MDQKSQWKRRLDDTLDRLASELRGDLYDNVVVPVVHEWFSSWDSLDELNSRIRTKLADQKSVIERKVRRSLGEFEEYLKTEFRSADDANPSGKIDLAGAEEQISGRIADIVGVVVTVVAATLAGGGGTALLASGPVGWIIGLIGGAVVFAVGRGVVKDAIESKIKGVSLPPFLKSSAKAKVSAELTQNANKFEVQLFNLLKEQAAPLYRALDELDV